MLNSHPARTLITHVRRPLHPSLFLLLLLRRPPPPPFLSPSAAAASLDHCRHPWDHHHRPLTSSAPLRKRKDKSSAHTTVAESERSGGKRPTTTITTSSSSSSNVRTVDPLDFSAFDAAIERIVDSLKVELAKLRHTGRSPEGIEALRVKLVKGSKDTVALGEIAQVIPRGRNLLVAVGEKDHLKPILSALQSSPSSLSPQLSPTSPLEISIPLPPPTRDSRDAALAEALKRGEFAQTALKEARAVQKKRLRGMELEKSVRPDLLKKAEKQLEKVNDRGVGEVKKLMDGVKKTGSI